jgi:hypothetical protein
MKMIIDDRAFSAYYVHDRQHPGMVLLDLDTEEWYTMMRMHQKEGDIQFDRVHQHFIPWSGFPIHRHPDCSGARYQYTSVMSVGAKVYARPERIETLRRSAEIEL